MDKLLIIGVSGLTGYNLAKLSVGDFELYGTYNNRPIEINQCKVYQLNKSNKEKTISLIEKISPNIVIDCSALHNVDYCEKNKEEATKVNTEAPRVIAEVCKSIGARFLFISTDYVYDGTAKSYSEESETNALNHYGLSKLKGEEEIIRSGVNYAICRTSLLYGWNPHEIAGKTSSSGKTQNYVIWALNKLRNNEGLKIVTDQYSTPTFADNLADALLLLAKSDVNGIFHTVGKNCLNRFEFTIKIAEVFGLNSDLIEPTTSDKFKQTAKRPMRCCLSVEKAEKVLKFKSLNAEQGLKLMMNQK